MQSSVFRIKPFRWNDGTTERSHGLLVSQAGPAMLILVVRGQFLRSIPSLKTTCHLCSHLCSQRAGLFHSQRITTTLRDLNHQQARETRYLSQVGCQYPTESLQYHRVAAQAPMVLSIFRGKRPVLPFQFWGAIAYEASRACRGYARLETNYTDTRRAINLCRMKR